MIKFKFNSGMGAIICSSCSKILKVGYEFSEEEKQCIKGDIELPSQYCTTCNDNLWKILRNNTKVYRIKINK